MRARDWPPVDVSRIREIVSAARGRGTSRSSSPMRAGSFRDRPDRMGGRRRDRGHDDRARSARGDRRWRPPLARLAVQGLGRLGVLRGPEPRLDGSWFGRVPVARWRARVDPGRRRAKRRGELRVAGDRPRTGLVGEPRSTVRARSATRPERTASRSSGAYLCLSYPDASRTMSAPTTCTMSHASSRVACVAWWASPISLRSAATQCIAFSMA